jgi:prevent-host-death family protein
LAARGRVAGAESPIDQDSGLRYSVFMKWDVSLKDSVRDDLRWFGKKDGRLILQAALQLLTEDPLAQTKNMKSFGQMLLPSASCACLANTGCCSMLTATTARLPCLLLGKNEGTSCWFKERSFELMKVISLSKAKAHLSKYGRLCHKEPVIVTVNGDPLFQLVPLDEEDDLIDQLLEFNPRFRDLLKKRLGEKSVPAAKVLRQL